MAENSEEKKFIKALNTYNRNGGSNAQTAYLFVTHATLNDMDRTLDLFLHIVRELADLNMDGYVTDQKAHIYMKSNAIKDAMLIEGYVFQ